MSAGRNTLLTESPSGSSRSALLPPLLLPEIEPSAVVASAWGARDRLTRRLYACADALAILLALTAAGVLAGYRGSALGEWTLFVAATLPAWLLIFKAYGLYDRSLKRISHSPIDDLPWAFHALLVGGILFWVATRWLPLDQMLLWEAVLFGVLSLALIPSMRVLVNGAVSRRLGPERVLLVGDGPVVVPLVQTVERHPELNLEPVGLLSSEPAGAAAVEEHLLDVTPKRLGTPDSLERVIAEQDPERVFVCRSAFSPAEILELIDTCRRHSLKVGLLPDAVEVFGPSVEVDEVQGIAVLGMTPPVLSPTSRLLKRAFDLAVAGTALVVTAPLLAAIALAVRLSSPGPVIFRQPRVGRGGRPFRVFKFRTMYEDAESRRAELMAESQDPNWLLLEHDPRVTPVGRFLRRTSLDELPQLFNVIRGEMSIVGPRPLPDYEDANVAGWGRGRLDLTPGITGLWQVLGRTRIPFDEMVKLDYLYVTNWSLWLDIRLVLRTIPALLTGRSTN